MQSDLEALKSTPMFSPLAVRSLAPLALRLKHRHLEPGEVLFRQGDPGKALFIIRNGELKLTVSTASGQDITLAILGPGDAFGELALLDDMPRSATATTSAASDILTLSREDFRDAIENEPVTLLALLDGLANIIRNMNQRLADVAMLNAYGRVAKVLLELCDSHGKVQENGSIVIERDVDFAEIAGLAGMYPVHVEQILRDHQYVRVLSIREDGRYIIHRRDILEYAL
jgi:CRP/FNR family cyclic AMP-dependent transcriptional regulator